MVNNSNKSKRDRICINPSFKGAYKTLIPDLICNQITSGDKSIASIFKCSIALSIIMLVVPQIIYTISLQPDSFAMNLVNQDKLNDPPQNVINDNTAEFTFIYKKSGGISFTNKTITFDSNTKEIQIINNKVLEKRILPSSTIDNLKKVIIDHNFFDAKNNYNSSKNERDSFSYRLTILLGNNSHTVSWSDFSSDVPTGLFAIADEIERVANE